MWPATASELVRVQRELADARPTPWRPDERRTLVAGCFVCFDEGDRAWAAAALVHGDRRPAGTALVRGRVSAAYEPGLLALREGALLEAAIRALPAVPEVVIVNATGRDHPRGAGLALHLGAVLDVPSAGVTDRPLLGLELDGAEIARLVRTRAGARPVVVHAGWRTDLDTAVAVVLGATRRARTPEPLRRARREAREARALDHASWPPPT
jgi:deoxyribonuclease V